MVNFPTKLEDWEGFALEVQSDIVVEQFAIDGWMEAMRDGNPLYWNEEVAKEITGGIIAPGPMTLTFSMSYRWSPKQPEAVWDVHGVEPPGTPSPLRLPMEVHFALKEFTGLKEGIVGGIESEFYEPLRLGDRLKIVSSIRDISDEKTNRLGTGRNWTAEVRFINQRDQLVSIERYFFFSYNRG
jgi:acyl dehydratase